MLDANKRYLDIGVVQDFHERLRTTDTTVSFANRFVALNS